MGRESARKKRGQPIDNRGELDVIELLLNALLMRLRVEDRITAWYRTWCYGRDFPRLESLVRTGVPGSDVALGRALKQAPSPSELTLAQQTLEAIGPSHRWPRGVAAQAFLLHIFPLTVYHAIQRADHLTARDFLFVGIGGDGRVIFSRGPRDPATAYGGPGMVQRRGYRPKVAGATELMEAFTDWFQAYLADPPVPKPVLTEQFAAREKRLTEAHSTVYERIDRVDYLLNRIQEV